MESANVNRELTPLAELNTIEIDLAYLVDLQGTIDLLNQVGALE